METAVSHVIMPCYIFEGNLVQLVKRGEFIDTIRKKSGELLETSHGNLKKIPICLNKGNHQKCSLISLLKEDCGEQFSCDNYRFILSLT